MLLMGGISCFTRSLEACEVEMPIETMASADSMASAMDAFMIEAIEAAPKQPQRAHVATFSWRDQTRSAFYSFLIRIAMTYARVRHAIEGCLKKQGAPKP